MTYICAVKYTLHSIFTIVYEELALLPCLMSILIPLNSAMPEIKMYSPTLF